MKFKTKFAEGQVIFISKREGKRISISGPHRIVSMGITTPPYDPKKLSAWNMAIQLNLDSGTKVMEEDGCKSFQEAVKKAKASLLYV